MGSAVTVTTVTGDCGDECFAAVTALEAVLKPANGVFDCGDSDVSSAIALCERLKQKTDGAFDVYIGSLTALWDFDTDTPTVPSEASITAALQGDSYYDFGSVGKGFACDKACEVLRSNNKNGLVAVGGSLGAVGTKQDGSAFNIGVRDPYSADAVEYMAILQLEDAFVSTSGSYEKYFISDGVTYHHILDARTGFPVQNELISVTVVADSGLLTDALTTACFCVGEEKALALLREYGCEGIIVTKDHITVTEGLRDKVKFTKAGVKVVYA